MGQPAPAECFEEDTTDLYENAPCGYVSTRPDGLIVRLNQTFLRWTGYDREALLGRVRFVDLLTVGCRIFHETHFGPLLRMQGLVREIALDVVCAGGERLPVLVNAVQRTDASGDPVMVRMTIFDMTERRLYERELVQARNRAEHARQTTANLMATISHDVRSPLNAIAMAASLLETTGPTPEQARFIKVMRSSSAHALALVDSVLDLSRLDAGQVELRSRAFDFRRVLEDVVAGSRMAAARKPHLAVTVTVDERLPPQLIGDVDKITRILTNLMTNAVKFTERGQVSLDVRVADVTPSAVTLDLAVSDTGIGIPADRLARIFDEYTQASDDIGEKYGGTGLGLAITRRLLRLFGSQLAVASTEGQGTTFSFVLELARTAGEGDDRAPRATAEPGS